MELIIITASACRAWSFCSTFINWLYWMRWAKFQVRQLECFFNISLSYIYTKCVYENEKVCLLPAWSLLDLRFLKILKWDWRGEQSFRCVSGTGTRRCSPARVKKKKICRHHLFWVILDSLFKPNIFFCVFSSFVYTKKVTATSWRGGGEKGCTVLHAPKSAARPFNHSSFLSCPCMHISSPCGRFMFRRLLHQKRRWRPRYCIWANKNMPHGVSTLLSRWSTLTHRFFFSLFMLLTLCTKYNNFGSTGFFFNSFYYLINLKVWGSKVRERHVYY